MKKTQRISMRKMNKEEDYRCTLRHPRHTCTITKLSQNTKNSFATVANFVKDHGDDDYSSPLQPKAPLKLLNLY